MFKLITRMLLCLLATGCTDGQTQKPAGEGELARPKVTDDIGEFDADSNPEVADTDVKITNPITGALEAYGPLKQQISGLAITQAVELFRATEGRYPKDYDEFMSRVIKANQIRLPEPGKGLQYQYDVANHKLIVVKTQKD